MRLISLSLRGYRQFLNHTEVKIPMGLTGICGANGVGKSKLIEAIGFALFGPRNVLPRSDEERDLASVSGSGNFSTEVCLELEVRGQHYRIRRSRKAKDCCIELITNQGIEKAAATKIATSPTELTKKVIEIFGITPDAYLRTFVARQKEVAGIQSITNSKDRQKLINRLIGIAQIEKTLALAESERKQRNAALDSKIAEEGDAADVSLAEEQLSVARAAFAAAESWEQECVNERDIAGRAVQAARRNKEVWSGKLGDIQAKREEIATLNGATKDLETGIKEAKNHYDECLASQMQIEASDKILAETETAAEEVAKYVAIKDVAVAQEHQDQAEKELKEARDLLQLHKDIQQRFQEETRHIEVARTELVKQQEALKTVQTLKKDTARQVALFQTRLDTVKAMGASGTCERCGQQLGDNLNNALAALTLDLDVAKSQVLAADSKEQRCHKDVSTAKQIADQLEAKCRNLQNQIEQGSTVPGQMEAVQSHFQSCLQAVLSYPVALRSLSYDRVSHQAAEEKLRRRTEAETTRSLNVQMASQQQSAQDALERATRQLEQNTTRRIALDAEVKALSNIESAIEEAKQQLDGCEKKEAATKTKWETSIQAKALANAAVVTAQGKVEEARQRAEKITALRHRLEVAERTETLLKATRDEITGDSCPRLSEMMDGWARSLMGSHFRRVQLTEDYRIEADNGSGMHTIEHFSGGEQTLLAVMLRVAISLYSQEQLGIGAGFLVLDEVFGDQDELHRAQLVQFLNEIKPHYHQILIVNHVPDVTDRLGSIIEVTATGEKTSNAVLRS